MRSPTAFVVVALAVPAVARSLPVSLPDGATWTMTARHTREPTDGEPGFQVVIAKRLTLRVSGDDPALLTLTPIPASDPSQPPGAETVQTLDIPVVVRVDKAHAPLDIANWDEVRAATERLIIRTSGGKVLDQAKQVMAGVVEMTALALTTRELNILAKAQAVDVVLGRSMSSEREYPNPLGGDPVLCRETFTMASLDVKASRAVVIWKMESDAAAVRKSVDALVADGWNRLGPKDGTSPRPVGESRVTGRCRYQLDLATHLVTEADCMSEVSMEGSSGHLRAVEKWLITQTLPSRQ